LVLMFDLDVPAISYALNTRNFEMAKMEAFFRE
jgi:hypothetical protein